MAMVERRAGYDAKGRVHKLRHSFCMMLAVAGVAPRTIQALAGYVSIETMRYMHVAKAAPAQAIAALDRFGGGGVETEGEGNEETRKNS